EEEALRIRRRLRPRTVVDQRQDIAGLGRRRPAGHPAAETVEAKQDSGEARTDPPVELKPRLRDPLAGLFRGAIEVRAGLDQVAAHHQRRADVLLEQRLLLRVAAVAVDQEVDACGLAEERQGFARGRGARGFLAGLEQVLLRLLEALGL